MPLFEYEATDASGISITAEIHADDAMAAVEQLRSKGLNVAKIAQKEEQQPKNFLIGLAGNFQDLAEEMQDREMELGALRHQLERPPDRPTTCGWCETVMPPPVTQVNCPNCGGTLPQPPGPDRGPEPPPAPREIPRKFEFKLRFGGEFWFGLIFLAMGLGAAAFTCGFTLIFAALGGWLVYHSWTTATNRIAALKHGGTGEGEITYVGYDKSQSTNGMHPYLVKYRWEVNGSYREGQKSTWNQAAIDHYRGEPVWVVYIPEDTRKCAVWPPMA